MNNPMTLTPREFPTIVKDELPIRYTERPDVGRDYLTVSCPDGWDDVRKLTKKVLAFRGRRFTFTGWSSDSNEAFFTAPHGGSVETARITR